MDNVQHQLQFAEGLLSLGVQYGAHAIYAVVIWFAAFWAAKVVERVLRASLQKNKRIDPTIAIFGSSFARYALLAVALIAVLNLFGVDTTSLIAILGAASLAIGLALQGVIASFAAGVMIVFFRPFKVGDEIAIGAHRGVVRMIDMFNTELTTGDNVQITLPNKDAWGSAILNYTAQKERRIDVSLTIDPKSSLDTALGALRWSFEHDPRVLREPEPPFVGLTALNGGSLEITMRVWCHTTNHAALRLDLMRRIKDGLDNAGVTLV